MNARPGTNREVRQCTYIVLRLPFLSCSIPKTESQSSLGPKGLLEPSGVTSCSAQGWLLQQLVLLRALSCQLWVRSTLELPQPVGICGPGFSHYNGAFSFLLSRWSWPCSVLLHCLCASQRRVIQAELLSIPVAFITQPSKWSSAGLSPDIDPYFSPGPQTGCGYSHG